MGLRVLVCGGRDYNNRQNVINTLSAIREEHGIDLIIHGDAKGADALAEYAAIDLGIPRVKYPANWTGEGRGAGPIRNRRMLREARPNLVLAFPGGRGTMDMKNIARKARVNVQEVEE